MKLRRIIKEATDTKLKVLILNCSLKSKEKSNTYKLCEKIKDRFKKTAGADVELIQVSSLTLAPGTTRVIPVEGDQGEMLYKKVKECDILIIGTPIWWGMPSSLVQRIIERFDEFDEYFVHKGVNLLYGKTFGVAITGTDDGVQACIQRIFGWASFLGFTIPPNSFTYVTGKDWSDMFKKPVLNNTVNQMVANLVSVTNSIKTSDTKPVPIAKRLDTYGG